jgi:hypothetical protein
MRLRFSKARILHLIHGLVALLAFHSVGSISFGVPILQLYIEGATYDSTTESWVYVSDVSGAPIRVWAIGNVNGPGGKGTIFDVRLAIVYDEDEGVGSINVASSQAGGTGFYNGVNDPSLATPATHSKTSTDGSVPRLSDGSKLPKHGAYGAGRHWQEFKLGDFTLKDSHIGDFIDDFPTELVANAGQISAYEISVSPGAGSSEEVL